MTDIVCLLDAGAELGEGTLWDPVARRLWWVDIWGRQSTDRPGNGNRHDLSDARLCRLPRATS